VDFPGYEQRAGWTLLRALPVFSDKLGLSGKADLVEVHRDKAENICEARPVEYKKGPKRKFSNDDAQLCAQAFCLEEMFGINIPSGAVYHVKTGRREVFFDAPLRAKTQNAIDGVRRLFDTSELPSAGLRPQCEGCSLHEICFPEANVTHTAANLFEPRNYK
jgi:CRISPR-associated exonuclease Cas4